MYHLFRLAVKHELAALSAASPSRNDVIHVSNILLPIDNFLTCSIHKISYDLPWVKGSKMMDI